MKVFRVEDFEGAGPYMFAYGRFMTPSLRRMSYAHSRTTHPNPLMDGAILAAHQMENHYCGFDAIDKLKDWFSGFENDLFESYMDVTEYDVAEEFIKFGKKQLIFQKRYATLITRTSYPTN